MLFFRIDEHTVRCAVPEKEIIRMGYKLAEIMEDQSTATGFMKDIIAKGKEMGFFPGEKVQVVQAAFVADNQLILNISDLNPDEQIDGMIQHVLGISEAVEAIGKDRLEEIMKMEGEEKARALNECLLKWGKMNKELRNAEKSNPEGNSDYNGTEEEERAQKKYLLWFKNLATVEDFCQAAFPVPGKLYRDKSGYCLLADLSGMEMNSADIFVFRAQEYVSDIREDGLYTAFLEEHADIIIKENPMEVLKNLSV